MKTTRRIFSMVLALMMVLSLSVTAFADTTNRTIGLSGLVVHDSDNSEVSLDPAFHAQINDYENDVEDVFDSIIFDDAIENKLEVPVERQLSQLMFRNGMQTTAVEFQMEPEFNPESSGENEYTTLLYFSSTLNFIFFLLFC